MKVLKGLDLLFWALRNPSKDSGTHGPEVKKKIDRDCTIRIF